jgi:hypothetical protein
VADADDLRHLFADGGDDAAARLIAEARAEAEARVRSMLAEAYTDLLLERARAALGPERAERAAPAAEPREPGAQRTPEAGRTPESRRTPKREREPEPQRAPMRERPPETAAPAGSPELGWYVYCVVSGDHDPLPGDLEGIAPGHPVRALENGGLAAIVSRVPLDEFGEEPLREHLSDMDWLERTARGHERVQEVVARAGTPVPMRLCTIYRDESGVRAMLAREGEALGRALNHLRGKAEWGVKAFAADDAVEPAPPVSEPGPRAGDGAAYMQGRLEHRQRREDAAARLDEACESAHAALCSMAVDGVVLSPHRSEMSGRDVPMILNASYLVVDADADAFHAEFDRLRRELAPLGIELERTGPWPPYNFVPGAIGAAW